MSSEAAQAVRICPRCHGEGETHVQGMSLSPFSGVPVADPQLVETVTCTTCHGTGERS